MSKILIVEDDKFLRELLESKLKEEKDFTVVTAKDGEEGLQKAREEDPDLIILDLILPGFDGFEVLEKIKSSAATVDTKVIVLSNLGQKEDIDRAMKLGAEDYLIKAHFTLEEIVKKIRKNL
ncbi:MAG TPA: response regulator [Candidatus Paceibacterota bacterium]|nr:response regulator [Candidatus Pacearchaeota archaeon]HPZ75033.1 response regulator [Candidatus Pacearchaeota archaeon]HQD89351.1 response regulator [Candidatus Pacearchaeota archaeon]HRR39479.1 response regulator [Candidatus Paceibacterota bacterium]